MKWVFFVWYVLKLTTALFIGLKDIWQDNVTDLRAGATLVGYFVEFLVSITVLITNCRTRIHGGNNFMNNLYKAI